MMREGICTDMYGEGCSLKGKIQSINEDDDFVCQECGDTLFIVAEPLYKKISKVVFSWIGLSVVMVLLIGIGIVYWLSRPDVTPPNKPILLSKDATKTHTDKTKLKIEGESGAKIYLNGKKLEQKINSDGEAIVEISTDYKVGIIRKFTISLMDDANNSSEKLELEVEKIDKVKDITAPQKPTVTDIPIKTDKDSVTIKINGEDGARIFVNDNFIGELENGKKEITLDTSGEYGDKKFSIYLQDQSDNNSEALKFTIIKTDDIPPSKPKIISAIPTEYYCNGYSLELSGEKGTTIYINNKKRGIINSNGRAILDIDISKNSHFDIILKDRAGNSSEVESFHIKKATTHKSKIIEGRKFAFVPNCRQEIRFQLEPYLTYNQDNNLSIYTKPFIETNKPFYIQTVPVTIKQFAKFIKETNYTPEGLAKGKAWNKDEKKRTNPRYPVTNISIRDIEKYIAWFNQKSGQNFRLPTVEEWIITINQNLRDNDNYAYRPKVNPMEEKVRYFISSLYEFSSTECKDGVLLLASDYNTEIEYVGKKQCEGNPHPFVTFRLLQEVE